MKLSSIVTIHYKLGTKLHELSSTMADEKEEIIKSEFLSPNTLIAWESIQLPSIPNQFHSHSPILLLSDPHEVKPLWSTQPVHKDHRNSDIFPPTNHENLNFLHQVEKDQPSSPAAVVVPVSVKWWLLQFKLPTIIKGLSRLFNFPIFGSTVLMLLFYLRFRLRQRRRRRVVDELIGVIKEKDEV